MTSSRPPAIAARGMVATSQPDAVRVGLHTLEAGGNAVDAAIAMAVTLTVFEPTSNGIGGDAFALVWDGAALHGYNGSGRSAASHTLDLMQQSGHDSMPTRGWHTVTVPGAPATWADLHARFGRRPFGDLLRPAVELADRGFAVTPTVAYWWNRAAELYAAYEGAEYAAWRSTFTREGRAPTIGEIVRLSDHARTLGELAETKCASFYHSAIGQQIAGFARETGGLITEQDLAEHRGEFVEPISARYRDHDVWEIPPNGQGIAALLALNILDGIDLRSLDAVESAHVAIEAMKLAFADVQHCVADPACMRASVETLLSAPYAGAQRARLTDRAQVFQHGEAARGGTVYLCAADADGMMVSYIQSNYAGFGSGIVVPGTGIALQNRGSGFSLDPVHPNVVAPRKRPFHTIIPGFLTRDAKPIGPFGVMGGHMQPQGHVQTLIHTLDQHLDPQAALDRPRWHWTRRDEVTFEEGFDPRLIEALRGRGHHATVSPGSSGTFGRGQIIWKLPSGAYVGGSDPRADGLALGL
jgi:gamma-glutamyltranspeptidase/glutathione hydrolase